MRSLIVGDILSAELSREEWMPTRSPKMRDAARVILRCNPEVDPAGSKKCWESHLVRAHWIATDGFKIAVARAKTGLITAIPAARCRCATRPRSPLTLVPGPMKAPGEFVLNRQENPIVSAADPQRSRGWRNHRTRLALSIGLRWRIRRNQVAISIGLRWRFRSAYAPLGANQDGCAPGIWTYQTAGSMT